MTKRLLDVLISHDLCESSGGAGSSRRGTASRLTKAELRSDAPAEAGAYTTRTVLILTGAGLLPLG